MTALDPLSKEIVDLHNFFTEWFTGTVSKDQLEPRFLSRLHADMQIITPEGQVMTRDALKVGFGKGYGSNPDFRIKISDVTIRHQRGGVIVATYREWQKGAANSAFTNSARAATVVMEMTDPPTWLHVHETWLPEEVRAAGTVDF